MTFDFDLFVIGGGSGGVRAARVAAAEPGISVGLAEEDRYGGTCVIRGCVPKKLMVYASEYSGVFAEAPSYGWDVEAAAFNWPAFRGRLNGELDRLENVYRGLLANSGVTSFDAKARLSGPNTVELSTGETKTARHILVATGGWPARPDIPGIEHSITSNEMFGLEQLPKSILIVGGGYIASEFAGIMNGMGVATTQYYRGEQILRGFDREARDLIASSMIERGIDLRCGADVARIEKTGSGLVVTDKMGNTASFDQVMYATGRAPNTAGLGLEDVGVKTGAAGEILVDKFSQTSLPSIYAIGDVTNRANLTPVAIREAMAFVETVFKDNPVAPDHDLIPTAIFTQPEMGTVGLSEEDARAQEPIDVYASSFKPMHSGFAGNSEKMLMKLIVSQQSGRVLGCHIVGPVAGEMIQLAGIAVKMGATKADFDRTMAVHPTMAEELVTMRVMRASA